MSGRSQWLASSFGRIGLGYDALGAVAGSVCDLVTPYLAENSSKDSSCPWEPVSAEASAESLDNARAEEEKAATERRAGVAAARRKARGAAVRTVKARGSARMKEAIVCGCGGCEEVRYGVRYSITACRTMRTMIFGSGVAG